ncbi:MAG: hypothetical protein JSV87_03155 [Candidatus Bathyarchaeota archaeon]|nr:MAG: hypothetical protein JSV87_03155 [Candidatus Bathyarchaeota archaeon]
MEYHKTKDPYHVKQLLGHKSLRNTEVYINFEQAIFSERDDSEYTTRIAKTIRGARALLEAASSTSPIWTGTSSSASESDIATHCRLIQNLADLDFSLSQIVAELIDVFQL